MTRELRANFGFPTSVRYSLATVLEKAAFSIRVRDNLHAFVPVLRCFAHRTCWTRDLTKRTAAHTENVRMLPPDFCGSKLGNQEGGGETCDCVATSGKKQKPRSQPKTNRIAWGAYLGTADAASPSELWCCWTDGVSVQSHVSCSCKMCRLYEKDAKRNAKSRLKKNPPPHGVVFIGKKQGETLAKFCFLALFFGT